MLRIATKDFEANVSRYEQARHYLEHLDTANPVIVSTGISAILSTGHGALGSMAWHSVSEDDDEHRALFIISAATTR